MRPAFFCLPVSGCRAYNFSVRRLVPFALALVLTLPACAQRGRAGFASHGAPSFHSGAAFRSGFGSSSAYRYAGGPLARSPYGYAPSVRTLSSSGRYAPTVSTVRPAFYQGSRVFPERRRFYSGRGPGFYSYPVIVVPGYLPYADADDYVDQPYDDLSTDGSEAAPPAVIDNGDAEPPPPYEPELPYEPAPPQAAPSAAAQPAPVPADTVTLIFKDGRPPEQVQNYLATRSTLTVIDGEHHHDIPLADLDIPATVKANSDTGVGFQLPPGQ